MYAQLPVFKYQTFGPENLAFSNVPVSPPPTTPLPYFGVVTDLAPKSDETPNETPPIAETTESPAESTPEAAATEGQNSFHSTNPYSLKADIKPEPASEDPVAADIEAKTEEGGEPGASTEGVPEAAAEPAAEPESESPVDTPAGTPAAEELEDAANKEASEGQYPKPRCFRFTNTSQSQPKMLLKEIAHQRILSSMQRP
jgi:hypothetical protein